MVQYNITNKISVLLQLEKCKYMPLSVVYLSSYLEEQKLVSRYFLYNPVMT